MKATLIILSLVIILGINSRKKNIQNEFNSTDTELLGKYKISGFNIILSIELDRNGNFIREVKSRGCTGGKDINRIRGTFKVKDENKLLLKPISKINILYSTDLSSFRIDSSKYNQKESPFLETNFHIIKWDSIRYLLSEKSVSYWGSDQSENDFERFSNYYNSGIEPKINGQYFVKKSDNHLPQKALDKSNIPTKHKKRFLDKPISAKIIKTKYETKDGIPNENIKSFTLNKGKLDGILRKMEFHVGNDECIITIYKVEDYKSYGYASCEYKNPSNSCKEGDIVSTFKESK